MMKDYLWDKSGNDTEIERLENDLKQFRLDRDQKAPTLPKTTAISDSTATGSNPKWLIALGATSFASVAIVIFSLGIFQITKIDDGPVAQNVKVAPKPSEKELRVVNVPTELPNVAKPETPALAKRYTKTNKVRRSRSNKRLRPRKHKRAARHAEKRKRKTKAVPETEVIKLTPEEKYALDQLMLGLSITSSNLKAVREKVNGSD